MPREGSQPSITKSLSNSRKIKASRPKTHVSACESSSRVASPVGAVLIKNYASLENKLKKFHVFFLKIASLSKYYKIFVRNIERFKVCLCCHPHCCRCCCHHQCINEAATCGF